jgi:hypothetical protein
MGQTPSFGDVRFAKKRTRLKGTQHLALGRSLAIRLCICPNARKPFRTNIDLGCGPSPAYGPAHGTCSALLPCCARDGEDDARPTRVIVPLGRRTPPGFFFC